jgi:2-oxo-4-hydroxy-4-carboxy--5-ureidoimidazoline (OHCU) decarboxylase
VRKRFYHGAQEDLYEQLLEEHPDLRGKLKLTMFK